MIPPWPVGPDEAARAARDLDSADAADILRWTRDTFERWAVASSMTDGVLARLAATVSPGVDVLFLDTGYHFAETLGTADAIAHTYPVRLRVITPRHGVEEQDVLEGPDLFARDPDRCCALRKTRPLDDALAGYQAWVTGARRADGATRTGTPVVEWDARRAMVRVNPLARWTDEDVSGYVAEHHVIVNPLSEMGYPSIGCVPCTRPVALGDDPRSGRWAGLAKTECGILR